MSESTFLRHLAKGLLENSFRFHTGNRDLVRYQYNLHSRAQFWIEDELDNILAHLGFFRKHFGLNGAQDFLEFVLEHLEDFEWLYDKLADEPSRDLLVRLLLFRIMGAKHVLLPPQYRSYASLAEQIKQSQIGRRAIRVGTHPFVLNRYRVAFGHGEIQLDVDAPTLRNTFFLEQYRYRSPGVEIKATPGAVVIDGGGCWGDTALYFAQGISETGRVYTFEFNPMNLSVLHDNLVRNPCLANRINVLPYALWDASNQRLAFHPQGPATALREQVAGEDSVLTVALDDFVRDTAQRVDFIKLDIEGSELRALQGAEWSIKTFRPKLAICLYHNVRDFIEIPKYIDGLQLNYEFYLGHVTIYHEETVLFAQVPGNVL